MYQIENFIPTFQKIIRVSELPTNWLAEDWAVNFTNPEQLVVVTIRDSKTTPAIAARHQLNPQINLAAPNKADRQALGSMPLSAQTMIYQEAIKSAAAQPGRKYTRQGIQDLVLNSLTNG